MAKEQLKKIKILLPTADWHQFAAETLWVNPIGDNKYVLENSPLFANDLSHKDVVYAEYEKEEGFPVFKKVIERSKHSTYRIFLLAGKSLQEFENYFEALHKIGCTYEGIHSTHFSVDVPAETDIMKAFDLLKIGEEDGIWFFESTHIGHDIDNGE
jgi:hypothetical protein